MGKLTNAGVKAIKDPGRHGDGGGLHMLVKPDGRKSWVMRYSFAGKRRDAGLGAYPQTSLADARRHAEEIRAKVRDGVDPRATASEGAEPEQQTITFAEAAENLVARLEPSWKNEKHRQQWRSTLTTYCAPIAHMPVSEITTGDVERCLRPIWLTKPETASRVRNRIERVLDATIALGYRDRFNPATWKGNLEALLPRRDRTNVAHRVAMPYRNVPAFVDRLRSVRGSGAQAVIFTILTASRPGEVRLMTWDEIDFDERVWTIPRERMKMKTSHRVPLSAAATEIVSALPRVGEFVFPGMRHRRPMSDMTMLNLVKDHSTPDMTVHGFRSSFKDWATESGVPDITSELCLAHVVGDEARRAYARSDILELRRQVMDDWARFIAGTPT